MKRYIAIFLLLFLSYTAAKAQDPQFTIELPVNQQPSPLVNIRLFRDKYGMIGQMQHFAVKITNLTSQKVRVTGTLTALLYCGNAVTAKFDYVIDPNSSIGPAGDDLHSNTFGTVFKEDCNNPQVAPDPNNSQYKVYNRIRSVSIPNFSAGVYKDDDNSSTDASQTQVSSQNPQSGSYSNSTSGSSSRHTAMNANDPRGNTDNANNVTNATQAQTQAYINNAQNPNNDAVQNTLAINLAKINAMKSGGASAGQRQQIQQVQQEQQNQNIDATAQVAGQLLGSLLTHINNGSDYETYKRKEEEKEKAKERKKIDHAIARKTATPDEIVGEGTSCQINKDYVTANHYYSIAAAMGNIGGICGLADNLHFGQGFAQNDDMASKLLLQAFYLAKKRISGKGINPQTDKTWYPDTASAAIWALHKLGSSWSYVNNYSMELNCRLLVDSLYANKYKELKSLGSTEFSWFIDSEIRLIWFYEGQITIDSDKGQVKVENLTLAMNLCNKVGGIMDTYLANADSSERDRYKMWDYNTQFRQIQELKDKVTAKQSAGKH